MPHRSLSANTLFHFTPTIEILESILKNNLYPRYALEDWSEFFGEDYKRAIPMVSFCDIPLSQIGNHVSIYGKYALGLKKEWGQKKKVCPIIYSYKNSFSGAYLSQLMRVAQDFNSRTIVDEIWKLLKFVKPYEGNSSKRAFGADTIRFYDEREWRYVPDITLGDTVKQFLGENEYFDDVCLKSENKKMEHNGFSLSFTPADIKYIIVSSEDEIKRMIDTVTEIKGASFSYDDVRILTTRIISLEQISEDF